MSRPYHHALKAGTSVDNFSISRTLGVGGFGITYQAYDEHLERDVALKEYFPSSLALRAQDGLTINPRDEGDIANYEYGLERFLDEAKTLARFDHPNIVRVTQFLKHNNTAYLVMNYEQGESLQLQLRKQVTIDQYRLLEIVMDLLRGLQVVHDKQFLHRDIKPGNIFICNDGRPVLLDFGSARQAVQDREMTAIITPGYAPYEQYFGKQDQGPWTDLYAIGATMFHCLTGLKPTPALDRAGQLKQGQDDPIVKVIESANLSCRQELVDFMLALMAPEPDTRPQSAADALVLCQQVMDQLGAEEQEDIDWDPRFLQAVEQVLKDKQVANAHALVEQARKHAHSVNEIANELAANMASDEDRTEFMEKTQLLTRIEPAEEHSYADSTADLPLYEILRRTETLLASIIGPAAREQVAAVARKAETREDFYREILRRLEDPGSEQEFIAGVKAFDRSVDL